VYSQKPGFEMEEERKELKFGVLSWSISIIGRQDKQLAYGTHRHDKRPRLPKKQQPAPK